MVIRNNRKALRDKDLLQDKARRRRAEILRVAREVMAFEGYPNFKLRTVAERTGISLGNLQYYFPSKHALVHALIDETQASYDQQYERLFQRVPHDPRSRFVAVIEFLIKDLRKPIVRGFFFQFWALATDDEYVERCMEMTYNYYRNVLIRLLKDVNTQLGNAELRLRAATIQSLIEGSTLTLHKSGKSFKHPPGMQAFIVKEALRIAQSPASRT